MTDHPAAAPLPVRHRPADRLHLSPRHRAQLEALLREHLPDVEVWAYGSRITGESHDGSDLDLVLRAPDLQKIPIGRLSDLWEALRESTIPFLVEARDWARLPEGFHGEIERDYVVLVAGRRGDADHSTKATPASEQTKPNRGWRRGRREYTVRELLDSGSLEIGDGYRARNSELADSGLPFARAGNVRNGFQFDDADRFPTENLDRVKNKVSMPGDVVFTSKGTVGRFAFVREYTPRFIYSPQLCFWRALNHELIDPRFLFYWMSGREFFDQYKGVSGQTDMAEYVSLRDQRDMRVTLPPVSGQRAIAHVLGALDDKIELNRRMSKTLEAMVRALFKSWFVDFDPVRAKMAGRDTGLPTEIAELFPDRMVDSKLGRTPEGWPVSTLGDYLDATRGLSYKGSALSENGVAMHNLNSIREGGGYKYGGLKYYDGPRKERHAAHPGDVIVANTEQGHDRRLVGYAAIVPGRHRNGLFSHHLYRVRAKEPFNSEYVCHLLNTAAMHDAVSGYATGTTVNMLPSDALWIPEILVPEPRIVAAFGTVAATISDRVEAAHEESENLACLRDSLLPRLVSGELRVGQMDPPVRCA